MGEGGSENYTGACSLAREFVKGSKSTDIALEVIRQYTFRCTTFDKKSHAADKVYANIIKKINSYHKEWTSGKQTNLLELDGSDRMK